MAGVEPGDLPVAGVDRDELVATPEPLLSFSGSFAVAGMQRLVTHDDPDPRSPPVQVQQPAQVGDERVVQDPTVLVDPVVPGLSRDPGDRVHLGVGAGAGLAHCSCW